MVSCTVCLIEFRSDIRLEREYKGVIIYEDGSVFEGHFADGLENGKGRRIFASLDVYEGNYVDGVASGKGKYLYADGSCFEGEWRENKKEGKGKLTVPKEGTWEGCWENNKKHGTFTLLKNGQAIKKVQWEKGTMVEKEEVKDLPGSFVQFQKLSHLVL